MGNIFIAIICYPGCDIMDFEINLIFLIKPFFHLIKKSWQKLKYLENDLRSYKNIAYENENEVIETDEMLHELANDIVNQSLEIVQCSPLKVFQSDRTLAIGKRRIRDVNTKFNNVVSIAPSEPRLTENSDCSSCHRLVDLAGNYSFVAQDCAQSCH